MHIQKRKVEDQDVRKESAKTQRKREHVTIHVTLNVIHAD